jgi:DNA polymerase I-like protein with 3'-5' exonuclease and polymerase domains
VMLLSLIELNRTLPRKYARIVATVHDSILFEIRPKALEKLLPYIRGVMEDTGRVERQFDCTINVPLKVDIEVGNFWGDSEEWKG